MQVDESCFGKRRSKQPQHIVVGAKDTTTGRIALRITDSRDRQPLEQFVQDYIVAGSLVASDKWRAYDELELLGYAHESWNHSKGRFAGTNQGENIWSVTKRHARKLFGGRILTRQLDSLCQEWMARANQPELFASPKRFTMQEARLSTYFFSSAATRFFRSSSSARSSLVLSAGLFGSTFLVLASFSC